MNQYISPLENESYYDYMNRIQELNRYFRDEVYTEIHHIKPRCMDGLDIKENLIQLYPEEHFQHINYLLQNTQIIKNQLWHILA